MPAGVSAGTATLPVAGSSRGTDAPTEAGVAGVSTVPVMLAGTTAELLSVSLVKAFVTVGLPVAPLTGAGVSSSATIWAAATGIAISAIAQFVGFSFSQILYWMV